MSSLTKSIKSWFEQENASATHRFLQMTALILGGVLAMLLGILLVGVVLIASPVLTVVILVFLSIYGIVSALGR